MDTIELSNGLTIKCKSLTKLEYESLLKQAVNGTINRFKKKYGIDVHLLANSQIIVKEDNYYTLYYSLDDLDKVLLDSSGEYGGKEILLNKNPYANAFPIKTNILIQNLLTSLKINDTILNSILLKIIDERITKLADAESFTREHFIHFIAVIGETLRKNHNAEWDMRLSSDGVTWNPYLKIKGQEVQFFVYLYEDIFLKGNEGDVSLLEIYETINDIIERNLN